MERYFNSTLSFYKTPFGAVPAGTPVSFTVSLPQKMGQLQPRLILRPDGEEAGQLMMEAAGLKDGRYLYTASFTPTRAGLYFYHFDLWQDFLKIWRGPLGEGRLSSGAGADYQLTVYEPGFKSPAPFPGGVMYQIFPDRFYESAPKPMPFVGRAYSSNKNGIPFYWPIEQGGQLNMDYFGGDLKGIEEKLPYLESLGVRYIYLNPIFEAHSNHRYNTADYMKVDPLLGTNEDFAHLCAEAKKLGIGIILDGVFSHTGSDSLYFNKEGRYGSGGAFHDPNSPYRSWYVFDKKYKCGYRSWWGFDTLPEVNEDDSSYRQFICGKGGVIDTWMELGASGFRLDVADELPDDFIEAIRIAVKAHGQDKVLLGEVWEDASNKVAYDQRRTYLLGKGLDTVMNYPFRNAILGFLKGDSAQTAGDTILSICENYPAP
ncbi:MAG: glycoside hydrolase family 13 protein, partial [Oscillospiraceae bacterium]|nr:glycoside hydrolase family 13 protein [Oscillospiraceae bacterium]